MHRNGHRSEMKDSHETDFESPEAKAFWIEEVLVDYRDGTAAPEALAKLQTLLLKDPAAREIYLSANQLSCLLETVSPDQSQSALPEQEKTDTRSPSLNLARLLGPGLAAAAVVVATFLFVHTRPEATPLATLSDSHSATLRGTAKIDIEGTEFGTGGLEVSSGIAELEFLNGVRIILNESCELEIIDAATVLLNHGKIRVHCPYEARGFEVLTPGGSKIVDLGTEFGLSVTGPGEIDLHVFDGLVELTIKGEDSRTVEAGAAITISETKEISERQAVEEMFTTVATLRRKRWESHNMEMLRRSDLLLYYDFSEAESRSQRLEPNRAQSQAHGRIVGANPVAGRIPGKGGLLFERPGDALAFEFEPPAAMEALTIAMWIKIDRFEHSLSTLLNSNGWSSGDLHFQVTKDGNLRSGVHGVGAFQTASGTISQGDWNLVVVTWQFDTKQAQFWCNGRVLRTYEHHNGVISPAATSQLGFCQIGAWGDPDGMYFPRTRDFKGRVDEVMIFSRALSSSEVTELYRASRP